MRRRPYPPSFKRIPARIIDPATGASTWALGSHRWTVNIGNFTKNAARVMTISISLSQGEQETGVLAIKIRELDPQLEDQNKIKIRRGREAVTV